MMIASGLHVDPIFFKYTTYIYPKKLTLDTSNRNSSTYPVLQFSFLHGKLNTRIDDESKNCSFPVVNFPLRPS